MKRMNIFRKITLLTLLLTQVFTFTPVYADGNNWVNGWLRADQFNVYNNTDYRLQIYAGALPTTALSRNFTTGWLAVYTCASLANACFMQVGLLAQNDGIHWFVEMFDTANGGVDCSLRLAQGAQVYWSMSGVNTGCRGAIGDLVGLNQWATVELVKYTADNYWIARVNGNDVAHIKINVNRIYKGFASMEEGYGDLLDPEMTGQFTLQHPEYNYSGWKSWPQSAVTPDQHNYITFRKAVNNATVDPNPQCPTYYAATPNLGDIWSWYAGTGGVQCGHIFPPIAYDNGNAAVGYTGSWTFNNTCCPYAWKGTLNWSNVVNDKATLVTIPNYHPSSSITRLYTMAPNRGTSIVKKNGTTVAYSNDYASTKRYQVARTWDASGATTMDIINNCCNYTDVDAFLVDTPQVATGTYDNYHYMIRYIGGSWTHNSTTVPSAASGTLSWTNIAESAATFTFTGSRIDYYYTLAPNRGKAAITIDGVEKEIVNACNATKVWQQSKSYTGLGAGTHTFHVANMGQSTCGDGSSTYQYIDVDKFQVYP
ncbi:MAG: hypothetical protein NT075_37765 [Chloroflexi bacterium]|nr:hypothetical protein [Chloroflexota bacterium]